MGKDKLSVSVVKASKRHYNILINTSESLEAEAEAECPLIAYHARTVQNQKRKTGPEILTAREKGKGTNFSR